MVVHRMMRSLQCLEIKTLFTFFNREKSNVKSQSVLKDRIESFDDYYACIRNECNLFHVHNWRQSFISMCNDTIFENYFINELNDRGEYILT
jgi:hypothetical protein